jgi:hypothetical protein
MDTPKTLEIIQSVGTLLLAIGQVILGVKVTKLLRIYHNLTSEAKQLKDKQFAELYRSIKFGDER